MTALLRKEVRSILPVWVVAMVLATLPVWLVWPSQTDGRIDNLGLMVFGPFGLGVLLLSITPFGQELNWGTFPVLLSAAHLAAAALAGEGGCRGGSSGGCLRCVVRVQLHSCGFHFGIHEALGLAQCF